MRLLLAWFLLLAAAAPASAAVIPTTTRVADPGSSDTGVIGPALAWDGTVVWGETTRGGRVTLRAAMPDGIRDTTTQFLPRAVRRDLVAGDGTVALVTFQSTGVVWIDALTVSTGQVVGFGVRGDVDPVSRAPGGGVVSIAGGTIAVRRADGKLALYSAADGQRRFGLPGRGEVLLAGDLLLDRTPAGQVRLSDRTTARGRYVPEVAPDMRAVGLQVDGTALFTSPSVPAAVTTRENKFARPLNVPAVEDERRVLAGGRVATLTDAALGVIGIDDVAVASIATPRAQPPLAFSGTRAAWKIRPCAVGSVVVWDVGERAPEVPAADCRPATPRIERMTRAALRITLACPREATGGCPMATKVTVRAGRRTIEVRGRAKVAVMPGEELEQLWRPARSDHRYLRRGTPVSVAVTTRVHRTPTGGERRTVSERLRVR